MSALKRARRRYGDGSSSFEGSLDRLALCDTDYGDGTRRDSNTSTGCTTGIRSLPPPRRSQCEGGDGAPLLGRPPFEAGGGSGSSSSTGSLTFETQEGHRRIRNSSAPAVSGYGTNGGHGSAAAPLNALMRDVPRGQKGHGAAASWAADHFAEPAAAAAALTPRQVSFESGALTSSTNSICSSTGGGGGCIDVTSSFLSVSPCSAASGVVVGVAGAGAVGDGRSPISVACCPQLHEEQHRQDVIGKNGGDGSDTIRERIYNASAMHAAWRNKKRSISSSSVRGHSHSHHGNDCGTSCSDGGSRSCALGGKIRSNRKKRSLHRYPPSKCLSSLAAEVSILDDDHEDEDDSIRSCSYSSSYDDDRSSFNTRPYKRQPSSGEWGQDYSSPTVTEGCGSTSPCFSVSSSTSSHPSAGIACGAGGGAESLLSTSAPTRMGEWGQFVDVVPSDEQNDKSKPRPQPLAFSPGLGGGDRGSNNLPYFPKSRGRTGGGYCSSGRRQLRVRSQDSMAPGGVVASTNSNSTRRFALSPRSSRAAADATSITNKSKSLFLGSKSIRFEDQYQQQHHAPRGTAPPPSSPSLAPLSGPGHFAFDAGATDAGGEFFHPNITLIQQPLTPGPSLDEVANALDSMQV